MKPETAANIIITRKAGIFFMISSYKLINESYHCFKGHTRDEKWEKVVISD
jgi:hypothetical protein